MDINHDFSDIIGVEANAALSQHDRQVAVDIYNAPKGKNIVYMRAPTGTPYTALGRIVLAYYNVRKVTLTQRRVTASKGSEGSDGVFEYIAQSLTDEKVVPVKYEYSEDR